MIQMLNLLPNFPKRPINQLPINFLNGLLPKHIQALSLDPIAPRTPYLHSDLRQVFGLFAVVLLNRGEITSRKVRERLQFFYRQMQTSFRVWIEMCLYSFDRWRSESQDYCWLSTLNMPFMFFQWNTIGRALPLKQSLFETGEKQWLYYCSSFTMLLFGGDY